MSKEEKPCLKFNCSDCCNPVKMREGYKKYIGDEFKNLPFQDRDEILIPETEIERVKLETYDCELLNEKTGLCKDYENRPDICKITECAAFKIQEENEQYRRVQEVKKEKYILSWFQPFNATSSLNFSSGL